MRTRQMLIGFAVMTLAVGSHAQEKLTYVDLVKRLTDLERLATLPVAGEKCALCSSYDRASRYDETTGKYVGWEANGDGQGVIRREGDLSVLAEMEGPGCIWRTWSARATSGHVRIYLDGAAEPAVDLPFSGYFDNKNEPFTRTSLVYNASSGLDNYVPIPYQKSCKIVADKGWGNYYHFTYSTFPAGTVVPTFKRQLSAEEAAALDEADRVLGNCGVDPAGKHKDESVAKKAVTVPAGRTVQVVKLSGPRAITGLRVKPKGMAAPFDQTILRELALRITWDNEKEPAVWSPLGDFFGTAPGANLYCSLPLGVTDEGAFYSFWYMPFGNSANIELTNDGKEDRLVEFEVVHAPLTQPVGKFGRFHAKWHGDALLPSEQDRRIDWTILKTGGSGRFVGVMLHVWNPRGGWWGEGDEKFFVDGEKFPSFIGTGSEDYFGYAWCNPKLFCHAYHNQTISMGNQGHVSVNRWHIGDNVPFHTSFEGCIEKYFPNNRPTLYDCVAYWYAAPGAKDPYKPAALEQRFVRGEKAPGSMEAEGLRVVSVSGGHTQDQRMGYHWSDGGQLAWTGAKQGDKLELAIPPEKVPAARYRVSVRLMKGPEQGIVQFWLGGSKLGTPIDLYDSKVSAGQPLALGECALPPEEQTLTIEITGANEKSNGRNCGLDYIKIEPVPAEVH